jgi:hypothetical protein
LTTSTGDLTIRGVIKPVTVDFELIGVENGRRSTSRVGFAGSTPSIARAGASTGERRAGQQKVTLEFDVAAIRQY